MPATYIPIASTTLSSSTATVTFSSIPQTYTDLVLRWTSRTDTALSGLITSPSIQVNSIAANYSITQLYGSGSAVTSSRYTNQSSYYAQGGNNGVSSTSNTFASTELYFPNYTGSTNKSLAHYSATENNASESYLHITAQLLRDTAAITSLTISCTPFTFVAGSTFHLYGIKKD